MDLKPYKLIIYIITTLNLLHSTTSCLNISINIHQNIENPGFHKNINWFIEFETEPNPNLIFALYLKIPSGIYINPDELSDLVRRKELNGKLIGINVNIENPMHLSDEYEIILFLPKNFKNKVILRLPFHLRYQKANFKDEFGKIIIEKPFLLYHSEEKNLIKKCDDKKILLPCKNINGDCLWVNLTYNSVFDETVLLVPIGNLNHYPIVAVTTILLGCMGCLYILSILMSVKLKEE